jgi:dTDP-4-amino-4,6-dideoxygalactose transaminase
VLTAADIEARPTWKPIHQQPLYRDAPAIVTGVADTVFASGMCLPSGSGLTPSDQGRVIDLLMGVLSCGMHN